MYSAKKQLEINGYISLYYKKESTLNSVELNGVDYSFYWDERRENRISIINLEEISPLLERLFSSELIKVVKKKKVGEKSEEFCLFNDGEKYCYLLSTKEIFIRKENTRIVDCDSVIDFLNKVKKIPNGGMNLYFRGQAMSHLWLPSLYREKEWIDREQEMIVRVISRHVGEFSDCDTAIEKAIKLKHYNIPSRLLDIVASPLTALYFACESALDKDDAVVAVVFSRPYKEKYTLASDTVTMLSNISNVSASARQNEVKMKGELGYQCQKENKTDLYWDEIKIEDLDQCIVVHPEMNNTRIIQQQGLFILCGYSYRTDNTLPSDYFDFFKSIEDKRVLFRFKKDSLKSILEELDAYGINKSSMYFDLEKTIEYEKQRVLKER